MANLIKRIFTKEVLSAIESAIATAEKKTSGEIRVSVRQKRKWRERKLTIEDIARQEFISLGMANTKERNGVLIFILLEEKKFYIFADEGIHKKIEKDIWQKIASELSLRFSQNNFGGGIIDCVNTVSEILSAHFPRKADDINELPNDVKLS